MDEDYMIPNHWESVKLDEIIDRMTNGANVNQFEEKNGLPITRIETIWNEKIDLTRVKYIKENDPEFIKKYKLQDNDILFSHINSDNHLGKTALYKEYITPILIHGVNLLLLRPNINVFADFINYQFKFLRCKGSFSSIAQKAVNQSSINQAKLKNFVLLLPPLPEQKRIVAKIEELFSSLDKGIESLKTAQEQLKIYRQAVLEKAFEGKLTNKIVEEGEYPKGWTIKTIAEIGNVKGGKRLPKGHTYSDMKTNFPYLRVKDFKNLSIEQRNLKYLYEDTQKLIKNYIIAKDDVYISIAGTIGQVGVIPENLDGANLTENAAKITNLNGIYNKYLANYLSSKTSQIQIAKNTIATTQPKLSLFRIEKLNIPIPSTISEQQKIVSEIESRLSVCDKIEESINTSLQQAEALRQSILKKAFEGKLVPQDPNDEPASILLERIKAEREALKNAQEQEKKNKSTKIKRKKEMELL